MIKIHRTKLNSLRLRPIAEFLRLGLLTDGAWLAGGALRSLLDGTELKDYDLFFKSKENLSEARGILIGLGAKLVFECPKHELVTYHYKNMKIQLVTLEFYPNLDICLNTFDINACRIGLDHAHLYIEKAALKDIRTKSVSINLLLYPLATLKRVIKYKEKGYSINKALVNILTVVHKTDPEKELNMRFYVD